jgi:lipopolysaccharide exporter
VKLPTVGGAAGRVRPGTFGRQLAVLMSGTALAQAVTILSAPVLSRLFTPEHFGIFTFYSSIVSVLAILAGGRYEIAVVLPDQDDEAANVLGVSFLLTAAVAIASGLGLALLLMADSSWTRQIDASWLIWIPASVFAMGAYQCFNYWSTRRQTFRRQSVSQMVRSGGVTGTQLTTGMAGWGGAGLIMGQLAGQWLAMIVLAYQTWREDGRRIVSALSMSGMKRAFKAYKQFPLYNLPQSLLNSLSQQAAPVMLAFFYGAAAAGLYGLALRLLQMPIQVISQSIRQVYLRRSSAAYNAGGRQFPLYAKTTAALAVVGIAPVCLLVLWGPEILAVVLGEQWREAGEYARWMVLWLYLAYLNPPAYVTAQVLNRQKLILGFEIAMTTVRTLALWYGFTTGSALTGIMLFSLTGVLFQTGLIIGMGLIAKRSDLKRMYTIASEVDEG